MARIKRQFTKGQIDRAGRALAGGLKHPEFLNAFPVINNWREAHVFPLTYMHRTLRKRAELVNPSAIVAARLKRMTSIREKLIDEPRMSLSQMQDIAGCRAVMPTAFDVHDLVDRYFKGCGGRGRKNRPEMHECYDYIRNPKLSGYRSVHIVLKYHSRDPVLEADFGGQRVEVQIRTRLQHTWATGVETVATFLSARLKHNIAGDGDWRRFFALMSSVFAIKEQSPIVPGTDEKTLIHDLRAMAKKLDVVEWVNGYGSVVKVAEIPSGAATVLLILDPDAKSFKPISYTADKIRDAISDYAIFEEEIITKKLRQQVVLVSVNKIKRLRDAYPNYYLDIDDFLDELELALA